MSQDDTVTNLLLENEQLRDERDEARSELAALRRDKERLDWLCSDTPEANEFAMEFEEHSPDCLRAAIDAAMKGDANG